MVLLGGTQDAVILVRRSWCVDLVRRSWCVTLPITLRLENTICPENSVVIGFMGCSGAAARFGVVIGAAMAYVIHNAVMNISLGKR